MTTVKETPMPLDAGTVTINLETALEDEYTSFMRREPVILGGLAFAVVNFVLTFLVTHGVITATQASSMTQTIASAVAGALTIAASFIVRRYVTPAWKSLTGLQLPPVPVDPATPEPAVAGTPVDAPGRHEAADA